MHNIGIEPTTSKLKVLRSTKWANYEVSYFMTIRFLTGIVDSNHGFRRGMRNYEVTFNLTTWWRISSKVIITILLRPNH